MLLYVYALLKTEWNSDQLELIFFLVLVFDSSKIYMKTNWMAREQQIRTTVTFECTQHDKCDPWFYNAHSTSIRPFAENIIIYNLAYITEWLMILRTDLDPFFFCTFSTSFAPFFLTRGHIICIRNQTQFTAAVPGKK